jgi:hypothetical protein
MYSTSKTMALYLILNNRGQFVNGQRQINRRVFRDRTHPLDMDDDNEIVGRYRLPRELIMVLCDQIGPDIKPVSNRNHTIPAILQIFCALRYTMLAAPFNML